jgi:hypothetical protein
MKGFKEKRWKIGCIAMAIILSILTANYVVIYKQNNEFKEKILDDMYSEWYQIYRLFDNIDKYYIQDSFIGTEFFFWYVNQTCHHFAISGRPYEIAWNMKDLLILVYDPLFKELSNEKDTQNKEKAAELFKKMNDELLIISRSIVEMEDSEGENLLDTKSQEYIEVNTQVKNTADKYKKLLDDYYKKHKT